MSAGGKRKKVFFIRLVNGMTPRAEQMWWIQGELRLDNDESFVAEEEVKVRVSEFVVTESRLSQ